MSDWTALLIGIVIYLAIGLMFGLFFRPASVSGWCFVVLLWLPALCFLFAMGGIP